MTRGRRRKPKRGVRRKKKASLNIKKILLLVLVFLLFIYLIYALFTLYSIKSRDPLSENISGNRFLSSLEGDLEKTIFVIENERNGERVISDVYVFLENKDKENSIVIYIPGTMYFSGLEDDFGSPIPISSLRYAGEFLQEGRGVEYTLWQLNEILGFRADNYIWITTEAYEVINSVYGDPNNVKDRYREVYSMEEGGSLTNSFLKLHTISSQSSLLKSVLNVSKVRGLDNEIYSNLSFSNVLSTISGFEKSVRESETYVMDLSSPRYSVGEFSEQGGQFRSINITEYDKALRRYYIDIIDRDLERERVRIEVYNGSGGAGKAGKYARKILNNGCDVVRFGNAPELLENTQVYVSDEKEFNNSLSVVEGVLFGRLERLEERPSFMTTGDIVILLGEDALQLEIF